MKQMSNASYWEKRKARRMFEYMEEAEKAAKEISQVYLKASRYLSLESEGIFEKYQTKHNLSEEEARRLLNRIHDKKSMEELKEALAAAKNSREKEELQAKLESPAYRARLERLQRLQEQLDQTMRDVYRQEKEQSTNHYLDLGEEAYYQGVFEIQKQTGLAFSFARVDADVISRVINSQWSGANYSGRIWRNTQFLAEELKEELLINLLTGRTERETAQMIAERFSVGASKARRLIRTESCYLTNQMEMLSYEECGIETYIFVATLDLRTSEICRSLDGKRFKVSEQRPGKNCPPMHPWCRSTTICGISDEELAEMKRRARNPENGKTYTVPADMTYEEWYRKYVEKETDSDIIKTIKVPESVNHIPGMKTEFVAQIQEGIDEAHKGFIIQLDEVLVENLGKEMPNTPYLCRYTERKGKHQAVFVINSGFDFSDMEYIVSEGYRQGYFAGKTLKDHILHEMAHVMTGQQCSTAAEFDQLYDEIEKMYVPGVSGYSDDVKNGFETIAEAFVRIHNGEAVPDEARKLVDKYVMRWKR